MNKTLEGMARAEWATHYTSSYDTHCGCKEDWQKGLQAALLWLADNVTDKMANVVAHATSGDEFRQWPDEDFNAWVLRLRKVAISAALRAAAGSAPTPPEVK